MSVLTLEEYVLTFQDNNGKIIANIPDYYETYIKPLEPRFRDSSFHGNRTVICCFHDDHDPSLGLINHRFLKGVKIYNCFGCPATGTIIRMHQFVENKYHDRKLTDKESALDLAKLLNISLVGFSELVDDDSDQAGYMKKSIKVDDLLGTYTCRDYQRDILDIRRNTSLTLEERANKVNSANIKLIATNKKLF